jgi:hypothetical protein
MYLGCWQWPGGDYAYPGVPEGRLQNMQDRFPHEITRSFYGEQILRSYAQELHAVEEQIRRITDWFFISLSCRYGLGIWEQMCGLPVAPTGISIDERRAMLTAHLAGRFTFYGQDWRNQLTSLIGPDWTLVVTPASGTVTITINRVMTQAQIDFVEKFCQQVGPAHLQWNVISADAANAFIAGVSTAGDTV